ncbi:hypothetical protein OQA88_7378 [Cercophora sp. LCS_1]
MSLCDPSTFASLSLPVSTGLLSLDAIPVTNFSAEVPGPYRLTQPSISYTSLSFCNVTLTYTHPGQIDYVTIEAWLPEPTAWNSRLQALGGGGWQAGRFLLPYMGMQGAIGDGYLTITTDGGLGYAQTAREWALLSEGNVNLYALQNLASVSLGDEAAIGKALAEVYYGKKPDFSYWNGCSGGGRQGLMLAQRYPDAYDGIAAGAPVIYWNEIMPGAIWPQMVMNWEQGWPRLCEMQAILKNATAECDGLDGVVDGVVGDPEACLATFDPFALVGKEVVCEEPAAETIRVISAVAAKVLNATWHGRETVDGRKKWYGLTPGAAVATEPLGIALTDCSNGTCVGKPATLGLDWLGLFVAKSESFDASLLTHEEFDRFVYRAKQQWASIVETDDTDLSEFRDRGGKIISWHGLIDQIVSAKGPEKYYQDVSALLPNTDQFFRHYEIPGLEHCFGGPSGNPTTMFDELRAWVENGTAPESLPIELTVSPTETHSRIICPYPARAK